MGTHNKAGGTPGWATPKLWGVRNQLWGKPRFRGGGGLLCCGEIPITRGGYKEESLGLKAVRE